MIDALSTRSIISGLRHIVANSQAELAARTKELSTGRHADVGLELGGRAGLLLSLRDSSSALQSFIDTNEILELRLGTTQDVLGSIRDSAQHVLDSLVAGGTAVANSPAIQATARAALQSLVGSLNTSLRGDFLFAGTNTAVTPLNDYFAAASPNKTAVDAAFLATFGFDQSSPQVSDISGAEMQSFLDQEFAALYEQPGWTSAWSSASDTSLSDRISPTQVIATSVTANDAAIRHLAAAYTMLADLGTASLGAEAYEAVARQAMSLLSKAIRGLADLQANVGIMQSEIEDASDHMVIQMDLLSTEIDHLERVNSFEVASRINELQTQLEASFRLTAELRELSLVHYL